MQEAVGNSQESEPKAAPKAETQTEAKPEKLKEITIDLETPVMAWGDMATKLTFRRPTGADIMALGEGYPININWTTGQVTPNPKFMGPMMAVLAGVPETTIRNLDGIDWSTCAHAIMGFFPPGVQALRY
jgi:Phage tail assembly chaperone proteins, E, or 41 or 14